MSLWHSPAATTCTLTSVGPGARTSRSSRISAFSPSKTSPSMSSLQSVIPFDRSSWLWARRSIKRGRCPSPGPQDALHLGVRVQAEDAAVPADAALDDLGWQRYPQIGAREAGVGPQAVHRLRDLERRADGD